MTGLPWDASYHDGPAPWDVGRPQPTVARLALEGRFAGTVLDAGCGTGENTLLVAALGLPVLGVDVAETALSMAREKAAERGIAARFEVADVLALGRLGLTFDTIIDSGVFHVFDDADRARYVASLASVLEPGGRCYLMCFSDRQPGDFGPRRVSRDELTEAFGGDGWAVDAITADTFGVSAQLGSIAQAWLATISRAAAA